MASRRACRTRARSPARVAGRPERRRPADRRRSGARVDARGGSSRRSGRPSEARSIPRCRGSTAGVLARDRAPVRTRSVCGGHRGPEARGDGRGARRRGSPMMRCAPPGSGSGTRARMLPVRAQAAEPAMRHAVRDHVGAEAGEDRHVDRARLPRAEHDDEGLGHARQIAADAVSPRDPCGGRRRRFANRSAEPAELAEGVRATGPVLAERQESADRPLVAWRSTRVSPRLTSPPGVHPIARMLSAHRKSRTASP